MGTGKEYGEIRIAGGDTARRLAMTKRLDMIAPHLNLTGKRFLDCGCGSGQYVRALRDRFGLDTHGIEFDEGKVSAAGSDPALRGLVTRGDLQAIDSPSGVWDYAMLNEVLEHVPDDKKALEEVARVLGSPGMLFVFSPNRLFPFESHGVRLRAGGRRVPHWTPFIPYLPLGLGRLFLDYWARNYWPGELARMVKEAGFSIVARGYVWLTFEDISGRQPALIKAAKPLLRAASNTLERIPMLKRFGVSQFLACRR
jgi:SAM-dependent methyltransferase